MRRSCWQDIILKNKRNAVRLFITEEEVSIITLVTKITNNNICSICDEEFSEMIRRMIEMSIQPFLGIILQQLLSLMITKLSQKDILCILYVMVVLIQYRRWLCDFGDCDVNIIKAIQDLLVIPFDRQNNQQYLLNLRWRPFFEMSPKTYSGVLYKWFIHICDFVGVMFYPRSSGLPIGHENNQPTIQKCILLIVECISIYLSQLKNILPFFGTCCCCDVVVLL